MSLSAPVAMRPGAATATVGARARTHAEHRGRGWRWATAALVLLAVGAAGVALGSHRGATAPWSPAQPRIDVHRVADLPATDLGWVRMRDHFTATIGPRAGQGPVLGDLLVAADTVLAPHAAFPAHRHAGVEVVTLVLDGTLTHEEGGRATELPSGSVQVIAAGAGIFHAEANRGDQPVRFFQLWLASPTPDQAPAEETLTPAASGELAALPLELVRPDVQVRRAIVAPGAKVSWTVARGRVAYVLCADGAVDLDDVHLDDGDGATLADGRFTATGGAAAAQLVLVDLPAPAPPRAH
ncbi:MAG TPA: pirin family protein [Kofleriaceae bacterium]|nr:pirin family protein [Kofleriaceae bacterium]